MKNSRPRTSFDKLTKLTSTNTGVRVLGKILVIDPNSDIRILTDDKNEMLVVDTTTGRVGKLKINLNGFSLREHLGANDNGYKVSWVNIGGKKTTIFHHQLICWLIHGPVVGDAKIPNHMDLDKYNNSKDNLEWVNSSQNGVHSYVSHRLLALGYSNDRGFLKHPLSIKKIEAYDKPLNTDQDFNDFAKWLGW